MPVNTSSSAFLFSTPPPPRSTLFPYNDALPICPPRRPRAAPALPTSSARAPRVRGPSGCRGRGARSEEHTSELQSHSDLVCRLLLEKKKARRRRAAAPAALGAEILAPLSHRTAG